MKITHIPTLRLILGAAALLAAVALLWWIVGYTVGKSAMEQAGGAAAFARAYAFRETLVLPLFAMALLSHLTRLVGETGAGRWARLAVLAAVAALLFAGERSPGFALGWVLFVVGAAAAAEATELQGFVVALVAGAFVAFAFVFDRTEFTTGQKIMVIALQDVFVYAPLLVGPEWIDRWLWRSGK
ncbi:MAG TPA: hypothetical protein VH880_12605 [Anaeromyxobacteraceae bacterium]|jgi:hypothetical protein